MGRSEYRLKKSRQGGRPQYPKTLVEAVYWDKKKMTLEEALENGASASAETEIPVDGMKPNTVYNLGTITENTTFVMAEGEEGKVNHYFWVFETGADVPEITWPEGIRLWKDNTAPVIAANHHYEISVYDGVALYIAIEMHDPMLSTPLTFDILSDGNVIMANNNDGGDPYVFEYSKNGGEWTEASAGPQEEDWAVIPVVAGDELRFRGTAWPGTNYIQFASTCQFSVKGNPSSLKYGDVLTGNEALEEYCYSGMFVDCTGLTSAENLALPATTLAAGCYSDMFRGCTSLTSTPELPATTLAAGCYSGMFTGCTSLTSAPELPATTLAEDCYFGMFSDCTGLTAAPELPATTLAAGCYSQMFSGCTSLTAAPELPATTLANDCYSDMFNGCTNLSEVKCYAEDISAQNCVGIWLDGVAASGTFYRSANNNDWETDSPSGIPEGWTVVPSIVSPK